MPKKTATWTNTTLAIYLEKSENCGLTFKKFDTEFFYFAFVGKKIILLHGFVKKTEKTPLSEINIALRNYSDVIANSKLYE